MIEIKNTAGAVIWSDDGLNSLAGSDLHGANLRDAGLYGADLHGADLHGANLHGANLHGADLEGATLYRSDLSDADLRDANLDGANLHRACCCAANLRGANLLGADLRGADLLGADLRGAYLLDADLRSADLRDADLTGAKFDRPSDAPAARELRKAVAAQIRNHPELHDQARWGTGEAGCGTAQCVAGWTCSLGGGARGLTVPTAATLLLWIDGLSMPSFDADATRDDILTALESK